MRSHNFIRGALVALVISFLGFAPAFGQTASDSPTVPPVGTPAIGSDNDNRAEDRGLDKARDAEDKDLDKARDAEDEDLDEARDAEDKDLDEKRDSEDEDLDEERDSEDEDLDEERDQDKKNKGEGVDRRSRVANAVQELLSVADREGGIGEQVREIAKSEQDSHEEAEAALEQVKERKGWVKFLIGPNYKLINLVEDRVEELNKQLEELKELRGKLTNPEDSILLESQVEAIKQLHEELQAEAEESKAGFSLFGWLAKLLSK